LHFLGRYKFALVNRSLAFTAEGSSGSEAAVGVWVLSLVPLGPCSGCFPVSGTKIGSGRSVSGLQRLVRGTLAGRLVAFEKFELTHFLALEEAVFPDPAQGQLPNSKEPSPP
jgi:hypothetical protein